MPEEHPLIASDGLFPISGKMPPAGRYLELAEIKNDQQYSEKAISIIRLVRQKYPNHPEVAELSLVEGLIYKKFFFDIDKAIEVLQKSPGIG